MEMNDETKVAIERRLTAAVREADQAFTTSGGSSRHWVHECFLPSLEKARLAIVDALVPTHLEGYRRDCDSLAKKLDTAEARVAELAEQVDAWRMSSKAVVDESTALWARVAELEREREGLLMGGVTVEARQQLERAEKAERRVAELERENAAWRDTPARILYDNQRNRTVKAEAQVAAARAMCEQIRFGEFASHYGRSHAAADVLRAMDEAAK